MAASPTERSWCVLEFARCNSFVAVQRAFRRQFGRRGHYIKLQTFLFQMVVTSCISVQYLWKYGFAKYSDYLYASCITHDDQKIGVRFFLWGAMKNSMYWNNSHTINDLKMAITEYSRNVDRAILNTAFENTVRRVNKCLETGGGHFEHYL
jgi:hypothetical protein